MSKLVHVRTEAPVNSYTQEQIYDRMPDKNDRVRRIFHNGGIQKRHLEITELSLRTGEDQGQLLERHRIAGSELGRSVLWKALIAAERDLKDVSLICCVTSTGFLTPGLSAYVSRLLGLSEDCHRLDVVGMGCNAGLNALNVVSSWAASNEGKLAVLLCVEICSAAYTVDGTDRTALVNSLFGDGAAAALIESSNSKAIAGPEIIGFASLLIPDTLDGLRYDWDRRASRFSFYVDKNIPVIIGKNISNIILKFLAKHGLSTKEIDYWFIHGGGKRILDVIEAELQLTRNQTKNSRSILENFGNVSSASFLFAYELALKDATAKRGDWGVMITMGPGCCIEAALLAW